MAIELGLRDFVILSLCGVIHLFYRYRQKRLLPLPPSLPGWPIVGNAFQLPLTYVHLFYQELGWKLGSKIVYVEAFGSPIIVNNDAGIARELLEKRSAIYSSRPPLPMLTDVIGTKQFFVFLPYGDKWRSHRRMFQQYFTTRNLHHLEEKMLYFARYGLLPNLFQDPDGYRNHVYACVGGISLSITYGIPVRRSNDPLIQLSDEAFHAVAVCGTPGRFLVNIMPILKYIPAWTPGAHFKEVARQARDKLTRILEDPYETTLKNIEYGTDPGCFISEALEIYKNDPDIKKQEVYIKEIASQIFGATAETTVTTVLTFILAMLKYPEVQRKLQKEIDEVVGSERLPDFSYVAPLKLPYFSAVLKEVFRWNPIMPTGVPHLTTSDDVYGGYFIPKGTTVIANAYAMLHDETIFPNPKTFDPERFIKDGILVNDILDPAVVATFGFGRRECPGSDAALSMIRIMTASMVSLFDIVPVLDANKEPVDFTPEFAAAQLVSDPLPFPCNFIIREGREGLLEEYLGNDVL